MKIDFYYWNAMCPLNLEMLSLIDEYNSRIDIHTYDISDRPDLAKKLKMYYPTLTVVDERFRFFSPIRRNFFESVCKEELPKEVPFRPALGRQPYCGTILPITGENYSIAGRCVGHPDCKGCRSKTEYLKKAGLSVFGFMNTQDGELLGGVEYIPSLLVPYPIPHHDRTAFITCVYLSDKTYDYKAAPLAELEQYLTGQYNRLLVISDEKGTFPNGDLEFFLQHGYTDLGITAEEGEYCRLHLLEKYLPSK